MRGGSPLRSGQAGFTLLELSIALAVLLVALAISAQLLMETAQLFAETSGEALDAPVPLLIARIRADVQGSAGAFPVFDDDGELVRIVVQALDGQILYSRGGPNLYRTVVPADGSSQQTMVLWRGITNWSCQQTYRKGLIELAVRYRRRTVPHTPLPTLPAIRGPVAEELTQRMFLLPRGAGLGETW